MTDMKSVARMLAAIKAGEAEDEFDMSLVDPKVLKVTEKERDLLAIKLKKAGIIDGVCVVDGIDNMPHPVVMWNASHPTLTLTGMEYVETSKPLRRALEEIRDIGISVASQTIANTANMMLMGN